MTNEKIEIEKKELQDKYRDILWLDNRFGYFNDPRDGNRYKVVKIGKQIWFAENFRLILKKGLFSKKHSWIPNDKFDNIFIFGFLYDWKTACDLAPIGWHLPSDNEWTQMEIFLGLSEKELDNLNSFGEIGVGIGTKLKSTTDWLENGNGNNESGFNAFPAGYYDTYRKFETFGKNAFFWTSTPGWQRTLYASISKISHSRAIASNIVNNALENGYSVRYVKD